MFQTKVVEKIKTHFVFFPENYTFYEIMWKNIVERGNPQMTIWRMRIACWIPKATNTHSGCVILVTFPLQQWLHERASVLRYTYIVCLVLLVVEIRLQILFVWLVLVFYVLFVQLFE